MKVRLRTALEGPNKNGKYRAILVVDNKLTGSSPWMSEAEAIERIREARSRVLAMAKQDPKVRITYDMLEGRRLT